MRASRLRTNRMGNLGGNRRTGSLQAPKRMLGVVTENFELLLKLAPLCLLPPALILWWHLKTIHWSDVFLESVISVPGLIFLVVAGLSIWLLAVALFLVPSLPIILFTDLIYDGKNVPREAMLASTSVFLGWISVALVSFRYDFSPALFLVVPSTFAVVRIIAANFTQPGLVHWQNLRLVWWKIAVQIIAMLVAMFVVELLFIIASKIFAALPNMRDAPRFLTFMLAHLGSSLGLLPGFIYLLALVKRRSKQDAIKGALVGMLTLTFIMMMIVLFALPVGSIVLASADVYSNDKFTYQILNEDLAGVMVKAGLPVDNDHDLRTVRGFVRYNFGGVRLLCRDPFDPSSANSSAVSEALDGGKPDPGRIGGAHCVPTATADLRKFTVENGVKSSN